MKMKPVSVKQGTWENFLALFAAHSINSVRRARKFLISRWFCGLSSYQLSLSPQCFGNLAHIWFVWVTSHRFWPVTVRCRNYRQFKIHNLRGEYKILYTLTLRLCVTGYSNTPVVVHQWSSLWTHNLVSSPVGVALSALDVCLVGAAHYQTLLRSATCLYKSICSPENNWSLRSSDLYLDPQVWRLQLSVQYTCQKEVYYFKRLTTCSMWCNLLKSKPKAICKKLVFNNIQCK